MGEGGAESRRGLVQLQRSIASWIVETRTWPAAGTARRHRITASSAAEVDATSPEDIFRRRIDFNSGALLLRSERRKARRSRVSLDTEHLPESLSAGPVSVGIRIAIDCGKLVGWSCFDLFGGRRPWYTLPF
jgi:hypothetical protein